MSDNVFLPINLQRLVFSRMFVHAQQPSGVPQFFLAGSKN